MYLCPPLTSSRSCQCTTFLKPRMRQRPNWWPWLLSQKSSPRSDRHPLLTRTTIRTTLVAGTSTYHTGVTSCTNNELPDSKHEALRKPPHPTRLLSNGAGMRLSRRPSVTAAHSATSRVYFSVNITAGMDAGNAAGIVKRDATSCTFSASTHPTVISSSLIFYGMSGLALKNGPVGSR